MCLEVEVIGAVQCDVSTLLDRELRIPKSQQKQDNFEIGPFTCHFLLSKKSLVVDVLHRGTVLASCEISTQTNAERKAIRNGWN